MTNKEAVAPQIVRFAPLFYITSDDLRHMAAEIDGHVAEATTYRTNAGTLDDGSVVDRAKTVAWATRLREIAAEVERVSTDDPETGIVKSGMLLWLDSKKV